MAHEDLSREHRIEGSSDRSFGLVFAAVFLAIGCWPLLGGQPLRWWALGIAVAFAGIAWLKPSLLAIPNRLWMKLGIVLGGVMAPVALGILFYGVLAPMGVVIRMTGKDPLRLKLDAHTRSYWVLREPPGPPRDSMSNQF